MKAAPHVHRWSREVQPDGTHVRRCASCGRAEVRVEGGRWVLDTRRYIAAWPAVE